ncbi:hypothetical protein COY27_00710 [Candidatus Woesearchaeota archaeon CG_4_10_14_0_2_um_filter_33_13]|nr:MAG: hypothetical protein COY27_00710 [Candidatus Woesearchaeota archaeon CG_4_10_14_0_2_um_filter_33_13]
MEYQVDFLPAGLRIRAYTTHKDENIVPIMFGAHLDTSDDAPNKGVEVLVHENYQGQDLRLQNEVLVSPRLKGFEKLDTYRGETIFTSNGTTLLGGDDKAGIAAIMTFLEYIQVNKEAHGEVDVFFTYDEETGLDGACLLNPETDTKAKYGFVFDNEDGQLGVDSFNAAGAYIDIQREQISERTGQVVKVKLNGHPTFPGHGKEKGMIDSYRNLPAVIEVLNEANATVTNISGGVGSIELEVLVHSAESLTTLAQITDSRFEISADHKGRKPVEFEVTSNEGTASYGYNLGKVVSLVSAIPYEMSAEQTDDRQGYVQPYNFTVAENGTITLMTLLRDFETDGLNAKKGLVTAAVPDIRIKDQYMNKAEVLKESPQLVDAVKEAMSTAGIKNVELAAVRGGDESGVYTLSVQTMIGKPEPGRRIPSVNIGIMGGGAHTVQEYQPLSAMVKAVYTALEINKMAVWKDLV